MSEAPTIQADIPAAYADAVEQRLARAVAEDVVARMWRRDGTVWAPGGTPEVANRLGWLDIADRMRGEVEDLEAFAQAAVADGLTDAVLLGMGGSSLAPEVFRRSFGTAEGALRLHVLDSTHPDQVRAVLEGVDLEHALMIVSSKSGGTIEPNAMFKAFHARQGDGGHYVAVTDPGSSLEALAREHGFRRVFPGDPEIGGRYSALSYFGLVPAVLAGVDVGAVLDAAIDAADECRREGEANPGLWLGAACGELARAARDKLTYVVDDPLGSFGVWAEQLVAESTGKQGRGILPVADEPLAAPDVYGLDRQFAHIGAGAALGDVFGAGHPVINTPGTEPVDLGRLIFLWEFAVAVAGWVLEINPFDQPNVQEAKDNTARVLEQGPPQLEPGDLDALLRDIAPPRYVAIMAYVAYSDQFEARVARFRERLVGEHGVATTFGYGPRFLHSTGQLHKGGPPDGAFIQIVDEPHEDLEVPGEPYTFGTLIRAQADGDLQTLRAHGLDAVRAGKEIF